MADEQNQDEETTDGDVSNSGEEHDIPELNFDSDKTILVVEDREKVQKIVTHFLEEEGFDVLNCTRANEAKQILRNQEVDLMILDIMLPEKDGITFLKEIKDKYQQLPVLMMSARRDKKAIVQSVSSGATSYLLKPFDKEKFFEKVKECLEQS